MYSVQDEYFGIISASVCEICILEWVDQRVCFLDDVLFHYSLHSFHHEGGEGHRSEVIQYFGAILLRDGDDCGVFPHLGNCTAVEGSLEEGLEHFSSLFGTVP